MLNFFISRIPEFTHGGRWTIWNDYRDDSKGKGKAQNHVFFVEVCYSLTNEH